MLLQNGGNGCRWQHRGSHVARRFRSSVLVFCRSIAAHGMHNLVVTDCLEEPFSLPLPLPFSLPTTNRRQTTGDRGRPELTTDQRTGSQPRCKGSFYQSKFSVRFGFGIGFLQVENFTKRLSK